jgi:hypothetical protein
MPTLNIRRVDVAFGIISSDGAAKKFNEPHHKSRMLFKLLQARSYGACPKYLNMEA